MEVADNATYPPEPLFDTKDMRVPWHGTRDNCIVSSGNARSIAWICRAARSQIIDDLRFWGRFEMVVAAWIQKGQGLSWG